jgi:16S rRNA C1402 N4-methylase RsmH
MKRCDIVKLAGENPVGIELGVAEGVFSHMVLSNISVKHWYSVDMWAGDRGHDDKQYERAKQKLAQFSNKNTIIKKTFEEALSMFEDEYFDFIYVDGYAHTGQDSGKTLYDC